MSSRFKKPESEVSIDIDKLHREGIYTTSSRYRKRENDNYKSDNYSNPVITRCCIIIILCILIFGTLFVSFVCIPSRNTILERREDMRRTYGIPKSRRMIEDNEKFDPKFIRIKKWLDSIDERNGNQLENEFYEHMNNGKGNVERYTYSFTDRLNITNNMQTYIFSHPNSKEEIVGLTQNLIINYDLCCSIFYKIIDGGDLEFHERLCGNTDKMQCVLQNNKILIKIDVSSVQDQNYFEIVSTCIFSWLSKK